MSLVTNNASVLVNSQDGASGVNLINRSSGVISFAGVAGELDKRTLAADTNIHAFDLPAAVVLQVYIKNTHATAKILITGTIQGGASQSTVRIGPGGIFLYWEPATATTIGFSAISYTSDVASATVEVFFGG
jgi:hypothetical protein